MNKSVRGPFILSIAAVFMLFAIVAYLIGDAESNTRRHEASLRDQTILDDQTVLRIQNERSIADRAVLHGQTTSLSASRAEMFRQNERSVADRAVLHEQTSTLSASNVELLRLKRVTDELSRRFDQLTAEVAALSGRFENVDRSRKEQVDHK
jgi:hypothetical protein